MIMGTKAKVLNEFPEFIGRSICSSNREIKWGLDMLKESHDRTRAKVGDVHLQETQFLLEPRIHHLPQNTVLLPPLPVSFLRQRDCSYDKKRPVAQHGRFGPFFGARVDEQPGPRGGDVKVMGRKILRHNAGLFFLSNPAFVEQIRKTIRRCKQYGLQ